MTRTATVALAAVAACAAGVMTTVAGVGGGVALLAVLAFFLPPQTVVVLVAPVLLVGNASRLVLFRRHVDTSIVRWFLVAAVPAAILGGLALPYIPSTVLRLAIGLFMVGYVAQRLRARNRPRLWAIPAPAFLGVGVTAGILSSTVGASGPFIAPFLEGRGLGRQSFVGTMAANTTGLNIARMTGYMAAGLLTATHLPELAAAMVGVTTGNYVGRAILDRVSERTFRIAVLAIVALSGVRLLIP